MLNKLLCKGNGTTLVQTKSNGSWLFCLVDWQVWLSKLHIWTCLLYLNRAKQERNSCIAATYPCF